MSLIEELKQEYVLYILGSRENLSRFCTNPFGFQAQHIDPTLQENKTFGDLLNQLDGLSYGDKKMAMEKWVALDCGMLPSAFVGLAKKVNDFDEELLKKFDIPQGYSGLVPVTEYCAIPTAEPGVWIGHTLGSIDRRKGLGFVTKVIALKTYQAKTLKGIAQYDNPSIKIHSRIADLKLVTALTPAHSLSDMTFVYQHQVNHGSLLQLIENKQQPKEYSFLLKPDDLEKKKQLQEEIQAGAEYYIVYPGQIQDPLSKEIYVPILMK